MGPMRSKWFKKRAINKGYPFDAVFIMDNIMHVMHGPAAAEAMRSAGFHGLIVGSPGTLCRRCERIYQAWCRLRCRKTRECNRIEEDSQENFLVFQALYENAL